MLTNRLTADDLATGFVNAKSAIAPALLDMDLVTLAASFMMIGDVLAHSGISEAQLVLFGPPKRIHGPRARPLRTSARWLATRIGNLRRSWSRAARSTRAA